MSPEHKVNYFVDLNAIKPAITVIILTAHIKLVVDTYIECCATL